MTDIYPPVVQRPALLRLVAALGARESDVRRDECGDWALFGKHGHIYAVPGMLQRRGVEGFQIYFKGTANGWTRTKRAMSFTEVTNDGDDEGMLFLDRLPTSEEAEIVRERLGVGKKRPPGGADHLRQFAFRSRAQG